MMDEPMYIIRDIDGYNEITFDINETVEKIKSLIINKAVGIDDITVFKATPVEFDIEIKIKGE